jgi:hypothetical protein
VLFLRIARRTSRSRERGAWEEGMGTWRVWERVRARCGCCLGCRRRYLRLGRVRAGARGRCRRYRCERRMLHLRRSIRRTRHSLLLLNRHNRPTPNTQAHPTLLCPPCITPLPSTPLHRPRPSRSSTRSALLPGPRHQHPSLTSELHPPRLHRRGRKSRSTRRDIMRGSRVW